jgi:putative transposase
MGAVVDCFDNAMCESFFVSLECELIWQKTLRSRREAKLDVFDFIGGWYNVQRRHSALDSMSPLAYEKKYGLVSWEPKSKTVLRIGVALVAQWHDPSHPDAGF